MSVVHRQNLGEMLTAANLIDEVQMQIALADRIEEKLPRLPIPVLIVRGAHDPIVSQRWVEDLTSLLPNGRLIITQGAHTPNFREPDSFVSVIRPFLRLG